MSSFLFRIDHPALATQRQGKMCGVLEDLVSLLGDISPRLVTYAGGASSLKDLDRVRRR